MSPQTRNFIKLYHEYLSNQTNTAQGFLLDQFG